MTKLLIYDESRLEHDQIDEPWFSFVLDDYLVATADQQIILHFWQRDLLILGGQERFLPEYQRSLDYLRNIHQPFYVRNAGGLAVVSDAGILNISLIFKNDHQDLETSFVTLSGLLQRALRTYGQDIKTGEVKRSYCPGKYDLSIHDRKFAGLAQRRMKQGIGVMAYLAVDGDQKHRAELVRSYYQAGSYQNDVKQRFPDIDPGVMASLDQLIQPKSITISDLKAQIIEALVNVNQIEVIKKPEIIPEIWDPIKALSFKRNL